MKDYKNIRIKSLNKVFGSKKVLNDFNLTLNKGEFVTFLGPSGCGKSTALNCVAGLIPITSGEIYVDDICIDDSIKKIPSEKRKFGMVFQNYALFPHLDVFQNVAFGLQLRKIPNGEIKEKVNNVLKLVHLEGYEKKFPSQMSGGEQQRVAIARCIVMEPILLMLDEPLSNLDAKLRIDMRYELKSLHDRLQITSIYVTHDQQEALALSDRIVVMKSGNIQQIGTPEEIYSKPINLFVADFMGFKNLWKSKLTGVKETGDILEMMVDINGIKLLSRERFDCNNEDKKKLIIEAFKNKSEVYTAVRPEDIMIGDSATNVINSNIAVIEYLGQVSQVSVLHENGTRIDLRTGEDLKVNQNLKLNIHPEKILVFPQENQI
jgi:putative spermidine/putrescine transport system ATP-binding protein